MFLTLVALHHEGPPNPECWNINTNTALPEATDINDTVWNSRAWTYQESQLSCRSLVFLDNQVFWHCNQSVWSEHLLGRKTNGRGHALDKRYVRQGDLTSSPHFRNSWKQHDASIEVKRDGRTVVVSSEGFLLYKDLVTAYTPRNMSNFYDKLAAFEGIGKVLEQCLHSKLLFGLPESLLDLALLWHPKTTLKKVSGPGFPSWSWAGWLGAVQYPEQHGVAKGAPRELHDDESRPERIRSLNRWYRATDEGGFEPINGYGGGIREALRDGSLPDDWGLLAPNESRNIEIHERASSPTLLRTYTMKATLPVRHNWIYSVDGKDRVIGEFTWDEAQPLETFSIPSLPIRAQTHTQTLAPPEPGSTSPRSSTSSLPQPPPKPASLSDYPTAAANEDDKVEVHFIALSETQFFRNDELNRVTPGGLWGDGHEFKLYNIMAVEYRGDGNGDRMVAYRRGLGRCFMDEWEGVGVECGWVNLG